MCHCTSISLNHKNMYSVCIGLFKNMPTFILTSKYLITVKQLSYVLMYNYKKYSEKKFKNSKYLT